ncbi:MAG: D-alanyl-D-alanine carboxypeptidase [Clostridia bacterium]|nr:D-alanyl-D-alanine carboxypeptidase [Clostridia bacterium]
MFKKLRSAIFFGVCLTLVASFVTFNSPVNADADGVAEIAMELTQGKILHEKNADRKLPMASTTKIMTALIIAEECDLSEAITVPDEAVGVEGSSIYLKKGETISVKDLLYGLMLRSGNDASCALAIHHSGSIEKFVEKMNCRAKELGANDTNFANPNGLPNDQHYTTARDLCNISRHAMSNPVFAEVVSTKNYSGDFRTFVNKNKLLNRLDGANGVKTGYTQKAGRCLVSSAKRENMDVVCVVLNCYDMWDRSEAIIENCFNKYCNETLSADRIYNFRGTQCKLDKDYTVTVEKGKELNFEIREVKDRQDREAIAKLEIYCENNLIFSHNLYTIK